MTLLILLFVPKNRIKDEVSKIQQEIDAEQGKHFVCEEPRDFYRKLSEVPAHRWNH
jgi:hypothetical protein